MGANSNTSLKYQWKTEIEKFTDRQATVIEGLNARRRELFGRPTFYNIINYELVFRDLEAIAGWGPDLIILDEAQRIKNWKTRTAKSVKQLESPYGYSLEPGGPGAAHRPGPPTGTAADGAGGQFHQLRID